LEQIGITDDKKLLSCHPMICYNRKNSNKDFLYGEINHFSQTKHIIDWTGFNPIPEGKITK
jgi:hypothetical protein